MAKVLIKDGATEAKAVIMLAAIANVAAKLKTVDNVTITAVELGKHMKGSKHYQYAALDVRSKNFLTPQAKRAFLQAVLDRLGAGYQGILEYPGLDKEHFHFEWDPK